VQKKIVEFTNLLRKSGIRVSVAEAIDSFTALDELSVDDREIFQDVLRTTMVKRSEDIPTFDELFQLFWSGFHDQLRDTLQRALSGVGAGNVDLDQLVERLRELLEQMDGSDLDMSELATALLTGDLTQLENLIRQAAEQTGVDRIENMLQIGFFSRRTLEQMDAEGAASQLEELMQRLVGQGLSPEEAAALQELIRALQEALRQAVKSFYNLTEEDIRRMREVVARLAQKIKNILTIRRKRESRGKFDLHQTLRRNMGHGGVPFELIFKQRRKDRPKLVILCDVSSSVANVSRFMLQFVYSLQEAFTKIRSFVFVAELGEVTEVFADHEIHEAVDRALEGGDAINVYTRSNFGFAFHHFWQNYLSAVDNRTTVLVLGDARNNYNDPRAWCLRDMHNKAKNVVWLNPESPGAWGFGDSVMDRYLPYCDIAEECRNLRQLSKVVDRLVL
jgi:uncharacterized protein with von Willebrand factor type A (vWA) domain